MFYSTTAQSVQIAIEREREREREGGGERERWGEGERKRGREGEREFIMELHNSYMYMELHQIFAKN